MSTSSGRRSTSARSGGTIPMSQRQRDKYAAQRAARLAETEKNTAKASKAGSRGKGQSSKSAAERAALKNSEATRGLSQAETLKSSYHGYFVFIRYASGEARVYGHDAERIAKMLRTKVQSVETGNFHVNAHEGSIIEERVATLRLSAEQYAEATKRVGAAHFPYVWADYSAHSARGSHAHVQEPAEKWRTSGALSTTRSRRGRTGSPALKSVNDYRKSLQKSIADLEKPKVSGRGKNRTSTPAKLTAKQRSQIASARLQLSYLSRQHIRTGLDAEKALRNLRPSNKVQPGSTRAPKRGATNRDARTALNKALNGAATRAAEKMKISTARMMGRQVRELVDMLADGSTRRSDRTTIRNQVAILSNHLSRADRLYAAHHGRGARQDYYSRAAENAMSEK